MRRMRSMGTGKVVSIFLAKTPKIPLAWKLLRII